MSPSETKAEKFVRLSELRHNNAAKAIDLMCNLTGPAYESTAAQRGVIVADLRGSVNALAAAWGVETPTATPDDATAPSEAPRRATLDFSIACSKADRAIKELDAIKGELAKLLAIAEKGRKDQ